MAAGEPTWRCPKSASRRCRRAEHCAGRSRRGYHTGKKKPDRVRQSRAHGLPGLCRPYGHRQLRQATAGVAALCRDPLAGGPCTVAHGTGAVRSTGLETILVLQQCLPICTIRWLAGGRPCSRHQRSESNLLCCFLARPTQGSTGKQPATLRNNITSYRDTHACSALTPESLHPRFRLYRQRRRLALLPDDLLLACEPVLCGQGGKKKRGNM